MKVIKRDGRVVDYDREKISVAIQKENQKKERLKKTLKLLLSILRT